MRERGVIFQLSALQHNMVLSGLPRKLIQPWSYEKDVQTELNTLALTAEMTSQMNQLASESKPTQTIYYPIYSLTSPRSHNGFSVNIRGLSS